VRMSRVSASDSAKGLDVQRLVAALGRTLAAPGRRVGDLDAAGDLPRPECPSSLDLHHARHHLLARRPRRRLRRCPPKGTHKESLFPPSLLVGALRHQRPLALDQGSAATTTLGTTDLSAESAVSAKKSLEGVHGG
jgi:hypothetical protein